MKYNVTIRRVVYYTDMDVQVDAESEEEAKVLAEQVAADSDWSSKAYAADYNVENAEQITACH